MRDEQVYRADGYAADDPDDVRITGGKRRSSVQDGKFAKMPRFIPPDTCLQRIRDLPENVQELWYTEIARLEGRQVSAVTFDRICSDIKDIITLTQLPHPRPDHFETNAEVLRDRKVYLLTWIYIHRSSQYESCKAAILAETNPTYLAAAPELWPFILQLDDDDHRDANFERLQERHRLGMPLSAIDVSESPLPSPLSSPLASPSGSMQVTPDRMDRMDPMDPMVI